MIGLLLFLAIGTPLCLLGAAAVTHLMFPGPRR